MFKERLKEVVVNEMKRRGALNEMQTDYLTRALETMYEEGVKDGCDSQVQALMS